MEKNATNNIENLNGRIFGVSLMNKLIAWDVLMNHIPKPKVHQGLIYWNRKSFWIVPK